MEAKNKKADFEFQTRDYRRIELEYKAQFTLKEENGSLEKCTIININRNLKGVGIRFHTCKEIKINSIVIIDLLTTGESGPVCITGILRWIRQTGSDFIGGVELIGNTNKLKSLLP